MVNGSLCACSCERINGFGLMLRLPEREGVLLLSAAGWVALTAYVGFGTFHTCALTSTRAVARTSHPAIESSSSYTFCLMFGLGYALSRTASLRVALRARPSQYEIAGYLGVGTECLSRSSVARRRA